MRRSKLESYEAILEALVSKPLSIDSLAYETSMDCNVANKYLDFLIGNGLVEERIDEGTTMFALTERGMTVFKTLNFQKYLQRVSNVLATMDEAIKTVPTISKNQSKNDE